VIDLQNEFHSPSGLFGSRYIHPADPLMSDIKNLLASIQSKKDRPVFWIPSEYDHKAPSTMKPLVVPDADQHFESNAPINDDFLASSHFGRRACCTPGHENSPFIPTLKT
jgi:hypothetical protein